MQTRINLLVIIATGLGLSGSSQGPGQPKGVEPKQIDFVYFEVRTDPEGVTLQAGNAIHSPFWIGFSDFQVAVPLGDDGAFTFSGLSNGWYQNEFTQIDKTGGGRHQIQHYAPPKMRGRGKTFPDGKLEIEIEWGYGAGTTSFSTSQGAGGTYAIPGVPAAYKSAKWLLTPQPTAGTVSVTYRAKRQVVLQPRAIPVEEVIIVSRHRKADLAVRVDNSVELPERGSTVLKVHAHNYGPEASSGEVTVRITSKCFQKDGEAWEHEYTCAPSSTTGASLVEAYAMDGVSVLTYRLARLTPGQTANMEISVSAGRPQKSKDADRHAQLLTCSSIEAEVQGPFFDPRPNNNTATGTIHLLSKGN